jgi:MraZ protein
MTRAEYEIRAEALTANRTVGTQDFRVLTRHFFGDADEQTPDGQGRILITSNLRNWAGLGKDLIVAGAGKHIEIWNPETRATFMDAGAEAFANFSEGEVGLN